MKRKTAGKEYYLANRDPSQLIYLDVLVKGEFRGEVFLNDCPVQSWDGSPPSQRFIPANAWLIDGVNKLELVSAAGSSPSHSRLAPRSSFDRRSQAIVRLTAYEEGVMLGEGGIDLVSVSWLGASVPGSSAPYVAAQEVDLGPVRGRWAWQDSDRINLPAQKDALLSYGRELQQLFRAGNGRGLAEHFDLYFAEMARAFPAWPLDVMRRRFVRDVEANAQEGVSCDEIDAGRVDFRLCARERLVELIDIGWIPLLRSRGPKPDDVFALPCLIGRMGGRFRVLR